MKEEINPALWQELKKLGRESSPEDLRQRGIKRLISILTSQVSLGIDRAINRTILERTLSPLDADELRSFTAAASAEFVASLHEEDRAGFAELLEQHRHDLQAELAAVQEDLNEHRGFVEQQEDPERWPMDAERAEDLRLRVQSRLLPILPTGGPLLRAVVADLLELFTEERAAALAEQRRETDADSARLQRRIAKLIASLEHIEATLARWSREPESGGRASGHREVRELVAADPQPARRQGALEQIYRANVELQHHIDEERGSKERND